MQRLCLRQYIVFIYARPVATSTTELVIIIIIISLEFFLLELVIMYPIF